MSAYLTTTPQIAVFLRAIADGCTIEIRDKDGDIRRPIAANTALSILAVGNPLCLARLSIVDIAVPEEPSPTAGMSIAQRILHVGGRNPPGSTYVEFGSIQAVEALVRQVLRDLPAAAPGWQLMETTPVGRGR